MCDCLFELDNNEKSDLPTSSNTTLSNIQNSSPNNSPTPEHQSTSTPECALLIDGLSLAFRSYYALSKDQFTDDKGHSTNSIYGFFNIFLNLIKHIKPTHVMVAFDVTRKSFRNEFYPEYKANRSETDQELIWQIPILENLLSTLGIKVCKIPGFEADDILATVSAQCDKKQLPCRIASSDRDLLQLISQNTHILQPTSYSYKIMDTDAVIQKYGLPPHMYPDMAAITGETSDNIIGVPGVGPSYATKWLQEYGSLENLLQNALKLPGKKGRSFADSVDTIRLNRKINALVRDIKLDFTVEDLLLKPCQEDNATQIMQNLAFSSKTIAKILKFNII